MGLHFLCWFMNKCPKTALFLLVFAILVLEFIPDAARAQELQFSKVLLLDAREDRPIAWTVPEGKAWKIESAGSECAAGALYVFFNSKLAFFLYGDMGSTGGSSVRNRRSDVFPVWLPSGTKLGHSTSKGCNKLYRWFSVMEYDTAR